MKLICHVALKDAAIASRGLGWRLTLVARSISVCCSRCVCFAICQTGSYQTGGLLTPSFQVELLEKKETRRVVAGYGLPVWTPVWVPVRDLTMAELVSSSQSRSCRLGYCSDYLGRKVELILVWPWKDFGMRYWICAHRIRERPRSVRQPRFLPCFSRPRPLRSLEHQPLAHGIGNRAA